jgi:hypothetical protein
MYLKKFVLQNLILWEEVFLFYQKGYWNTIQYPFVRIFLSGVFLSYF